MESEPILAFFQVLNIYLEARILPFTLMRIRIRIKVTSRIRIRIKAMRIRNTGDNNGSRRGKEDHAFCYRWHWRHSKTPDN
jgi:hypothetical protein